MGIDPGLSGGIAVLSDEFKSADAWMYPGDIPTAGKLLREEILVKYPDIRLCAIEKVSSMPKQGIASAFKFGGNYFSWQMAMTMARIPYIFVTPNSWQNKLLDASSGESSDTKARSLSQARRLFPHIDLSLQKHNGKSDALHLARWAWQEYMKHHQGDKRKIQRVRLK